MDKTLKEKYLEAFRINSDFMKIVNKIFTPKLASDHAFLWMNAEGIPLLKVFHGRAPVVIVLDMLKFEDIESELMEIRNQMEQDSMNKLKDSLARTLKKEWGSDG